MVLQEIEYSNRTEFILQITDRSSELLETAIRHNDSPEPQAAVTARELDSTTIELEVVDNGPGIPAAEQQIITGGEQITALNHGSGLGLWVVKWIVEAYGGTLNKHRRLGAVERLAPGRTTEHVCPRSNTVGIEFWY